VISTSSASDPLSAPSLRTRKRLRTRRDLQRAAIRQVEDRGYENTSVEDFCEEAEVSRSTFFRYFGSKAAVFEADLIEEMAAERWQDPTDPTLSGLCELICSTYRGLTPEQFEQERRRIRLLQTVPELRAGFANELIRPLPFLIAFVATMLGQPSDAQRVRTIAGAVFGVLATMRAPDSHGKFDLPATKDEAIALFKATFADLERVLDVSATGP
jgi:AcrR family transcriptional regulator